MKKQKMILKLAGAFLVSTAIAAFVTIPVVSCSNEDPKNSYIDGLPKEYNCEQRTTSSTQFVIHSFFKGVDESASENIVWSFSVMNKDKDITDDQNIFQFEKETHTLIFLSNNLTSEDNGDYQLFLKAELNGEILETTSIITIRNIDITLTEMYINGKIFDYQQDVLSIPKTGIIINFRFKLNGEYQLVGDVSNITVDCDQRYITNKNAELKDKNTVQIEFNSKGNGPESRIDIIFSDTIKIDFMSYPNLF